MQRWTWAGDRNADGQSPIFQRLIFDLCPHSLHAKCYEFTGTCGNDRSGILASEGYMAGNKEGNQKRLKIARFLWPLLVELWIFVAIATFIVVRVLESHAAQRILGAIKSSHPL